VPAAGAGTWVVLPPGHAGWVGWRLADPAVVVAADPLPACRPKVRVRLFGRPDQRVYGLVPAAQVYSKAERIRLGAAYGPVVAACDYR
jgi:hypothetical protein